MLLPNHKTSYYIPSAHPSGMIRCVALSPHASCRFSTASVRTPVQEKPYSSHTERASYTRDPCTLFHRDMGVMVGVGVNFPDPLNIARGFRLARAAVIVCNGCVGTPEDGNHFV